MILAIDTSCARCAVALVADADISRQILPMERGHAEALMPVIEAVLAEAGARYRDLTRIAVCTGPGSFTGIRVGIAAARGLALGLGIPAIGITRLEALAAQAATGRPCSVRVPAPGGAAYLQEFDAQGRAEAPPKLVGSECSAPQDRTLVGLGGLLPEALPDPVVVARLAAERAADAPPAPLYLREAGAAPPREAPPPLLDP